MPGRLQPHLLLTVLCFSLVLWLCEGQTKDPLVALASSKQLSACSFQLGAADNVINLAPLARTDGLPRFVATFNFTQQVWRYSFSPCNDYDVPSNNPHNGHGDGCHSVSVCKYAVEHDSLYLYTLGIHSSAKFEVKKDTDQQPAVYLVFQGIKSMRQRSTVIRLVCNESRAGKDDGLFRITSDPGKGPLSAELHHQCCCPGACWNAGIGLTAAPPASNGTNLTVGESVAGPRVEETEGDVMLVIVGTVLAILMLVALIGGLCYIQRSHLQLYSKLPASLKPHSSGASTTDFRDYEPSSVVRKKQLPILEDTMIHLDSLNMFRRLGGGIFLDTHLAKWKELTVAVKRLTILVHENQMTPDAMKLMKNEVWFLSRQRHRNIVSILGLCLDGKLPSIITECVTGDCLRDFLNKQGRLLAWPHRVRMCAQIADGMGFLHSSKPPIIHRDLRCGNIFLTDSDIVKVADFGLIKLLQPIREECPQDDCCCRRTMSACPASIRWTAPELLASPRAQERLLPPSQKKSSGSDVAGSSRKMSADADAGSSRKISADADARSSRKLSADVKSVILPACDVYSFSMVMWEVPMCEDPFAEISSEIQVQKIVETGGRPETPPSADMMPQYKELMKQCWDQAPSNRPTFKQVAVRLKDLASLARSYQKQLQNRQRTQKLQDTSPV